jgi:hypothetical protein
MEVVNVRALGGVSGARKAGVVYCGRPSPLGNPCSEPGVPCPVCRQVHFGPGMVELTADRSIPCYRKWLWARLRERHFVVLEALRALKPEDRLACWCAPKPCHCDVIIKAWEWCREQGMFS